MRFYMCVYASTRRLFPKFPKNHVLPLCARQKFFCVYKNEPPSKKTKKNFLACKGCISTWEFWEFGNRRVRTPFVESANGNFQRKMGISTAKIWEFGNRARQDAIFQFPFLGIGNWEFGNLGIWEFGNLGIWEFGN